jgi:PAS domain S-box-containing protein
MNAASTELDSVDNASDRLLLSRALRAAFIACAFVLTSLIVSGSFFSLRSAATICIFCVLGLSYHLLQRSIRRGMAVFVVGMWFSVSWATAWFAGVYSTNWVVYVVLITLTGWIMGSRWLIGITTATVALAMGLGGAELLGLFRPTPRSSVWVVVAVLVSTLIVASYVTSLAYRSLRQGRDHALALAKELEAQNRMLVRREQDLQMILDHVPAGIASFDAQSRLRYGNQRYAALFGAKPEEIVGKNVSQYVPQVALDALNQQWNKCLAGERGGYRRTNQNPVTGEISIIDVQLAPEFNDGQVTGLFGLLIDVTEKVAAEARFRELNDTLERRVEQRTQELEATMERLHHSQEELVRSETRAALSSLVSSVSHELSTPLGNSLMTATTLVDQSKTFQRLIDRHQLKRSDLNVFVGMVHEGNDLMARNLHRASELLKNFRQVANDQASEERRCFDLATMVEEIVGTLKPSLKRHPQQIVLNIPDGIVMDSHPGPLGQVIINLINNAYLHAFEGRTDGVLNISAELVDGKKVVLRIADNGHGIPQENLARLFEPFFSTKKGKGGTGLGMSIVHNLVSKTLNGSITVHSQVGVGTCFEVQLALIAPIADP